MALANNQRDQLAKRLKADIEVREGYTVDLSYLSSGDPLLTIKNTSATIIAYCSIARRSFDGFNVVAELSSSAAEGLPEHVAYMLVDSDEADAVKAKLSVYAYSLGCSSTKLGFKAVIASSDLVDANVNAEIPNSARLGAVGQ